ncbi:MAG: SCO family protein [Janthinobacterium lividum]
MNRRRLPFAAIAAILVFLVAAGAGALWRARPVAPPGPLVGSNIGGPYKLVDQDGRPVTEHSYDGKFRLMYFGYTFCPDVCPTDMQKMAQGLRAFAATDPKREAKVVGMFVTVDPARDTPAAVKAFVRAFSPTLVGLTGSQAQVDAVTHGFRIFVHRNTGPNYLVDHSATMYLMGPDNAPISFLDHDATPATIAAELGKYVR